MCGDGRCVLCARKKADDVGHFVVECEEFMWRRQLVEKVGKIEGAERWVESGDKEVKVVRLLGETWIGLMYVCCMSD